MAEFQNGMAGGTAKGLTQVLGESKNEDVDFENMVQRLMKADFDDWPNEAGFEGLDEIRGPIDLVVKGSIPSWAAGTLYRTGPGQYTVDDTPKGTFRAQHWFDGFGHSHRFSIIANPDDVDAPVRVEYASKRHAQALIDTIRKTGRRPDITFGQRADPCIGLFGKIMSMWRGSPTGQDPRFDNISVDLKTNVPGLPSKAGGASESGHRGGIKNIWLTTDAATMKEIDHQTLEPIGLARQFKLHPLLTGPLSCAHAQRDPETGDFYNYNLDLGFRTYYRVFRTSASTGETDILASITAPDLMPAYIHSFFLSPSFVILCVPSTHMGMRGIAVPWKKNIVEAIDPFDESKLCRWFIVDRHGDSGVVAEFESPAGFFFHSVNSFEERDEETGDTIVYCDAMMYPTTEVIRAYEMDVILQNDGAAKNFWGDETRNRSCHVRLTRHKFRIPSSDAHETDKSFARPTPEKVFEIRAPHAGELPAINRAYATKKYRYVYSLANRGYSSLLDSLVKTDLVTRETVFWDNPKGHSPGEAVFVPRPKTQRGEDLDEDDGVLLSVVLDGVNKTSYLLCLDAKTMEELGRAECDFAIAVGFHGLHWPDAPDGASDAS
ncbi:torulene oxygenase [Hypoxylon rubiginosum]|uniref:Torulene oxygenase n=1 Tax=Hypoxylon rubiginosum TaxID=110542 RepID=A0ACC0D2C5_9PEZI|nr:torulene oxygenase [Hypoxylon rubiginosum]